MSILRSSKLDKSHPERMEKLISGWMGTSGGRHIIRRFYVEIYRNGGGIPCDRCSRPHGTDDQAPKRGSKLSSHEGQLPGGQFGESESLTSEFVTSLRTEEYEKRELWIGLHLPGTHHFIRSELAEQSKSIKRVSALMECMAALKSGTRTTRAILPDFRGDSSSWPVYRSPPDPRSLFPVPGSLLLPSPGSWAADD